MFLLYHHHRGQFSTGFCNTTFLQFHTLWGLVKENDSAPPQSDLE